MRKPQLYVGIVAGLLLLAACGGDSGSSSSEDETDVPNTTVTSEPPTSDDADSDGGDSGGTITVGEDTYELDVQNCVLGSGLGTFGVTALTTTGSHEFSAGSVAGTARITFRGVGNPDVWTAVGATPSITEDSFEFSGTVASGSGPETTMDVSISC